MASNLSNLFASKESVQSLAEQIASGTCSEEQLGLSLRSLQLNMGLSVLHGLSNIDQQTSELDYLSQRLTNKFSEKVEEAIDSDTLELSELQSLMNSIQDQRLKIIEAKRRIVQSPSKIIPEDLISGEETQLLRLLKSFSTPEEKAKFMQAVQEALKPEDSSFPIEDEPVAPEEL